jgi:hypothetical protein
MGKTTNRDKERPKGPSEPTKTTPTPKTTPTQAKGSHTNPKVTPQVPKGAVLTQQPSSGAAKSTPIKATTTAPTKVSGNSEVKQAPAKPTTSADANANSFIIPKGGDKRGRDPSLGSKSGQSIVPPPTKQPRTYALAAKGRDFHRVQDQQWPELQLRVYKDTVYHDPISYDEFGVVREIMLKHSLTALEQNPDMGSLFQISSTYYNKLIHCGVYNFANAQAFNWFKKELPTACSGAFRGWSRDEQVTTFVKVFMPQGFDSLSAQDYLKASRLMFKTQGTPDIPWGLINESIHPTEHTRQIIASIPTVTLQAIIAKGVETKEKSGVWKTEGFMAPFKVAVASATDLRNANTINFSHSDLEQGETSVPDEIEMGSDSPPASPARSTTSSTSTQQPLGPELTPSKFPELINDPNLSQAATPEATEDNGDLEKMDFHLLDDAGAGGGSWADEI